MVCTKCHATDSCTKCINREARAIRQKTAGAKYTATHRERKRKRVDDLVRQNESLDRALRDFQDRIVDSRQGHTPVLEQSA
jgi:hypothetical protein